MGRKKAAYGNGSVYFAGSRFIAQLTYTIEIEGIEYSKRISGTGSTAAKAIRKRNKNAELWKEEQKKALLEQKDSAPEKGEEDGAEKSDPENKKITLNEVFSLNLKMIEARAQISTCENYEMYYDGYVRNSVLGAMAIEEITEEQLLDFYTETRKNGRKRVKKDNKNVPIAPKPLSINTVNHIRFVLANTFKYAADKHIIQVNPHIAICPFKPGTATMIDYDQEDMDSDSDELDALQRVISEEDMKRILEYAYKNSRLAGLFAWASNSGMRQGECLGLKRICADPAQFYVLVKRSLTYIKDRRPDAETTTIPRLKLPKNGKERKIPYNQNLRDIYKYQMAQTEREKKAAGERYKDKGLLFADEFGGYLRPWKVLKEFHRILEAVGVEKHRFHDLRHTFVSLMVRESQRRGNGVSVLDICSITGHSDPTVTLKIYGGLFPNSTKTAMQFLDDCTSIGLPQEIREEFCA